jgi:hypothetical protein
MVILRDLDDEIGGSSSFPPFGSELERQIRSHFTREDGSFNEEGYFSELLGFILSDSDSSDNDCVIIPCSSFTGKELILFLPKSGDEMFVHSKFTSEEIVQVLRNAVSFSESGDETNVVVEPVGVEELVIVVNSRAPIIL